jgi:catechol 2,3-dioxygenase-like lactoylglutathione lyase family enzyme
MAMADEIVAKSGAGAKLPERLHHNAYVCADQERTRRFYEDVVGLPLIATWIEQTEMEGRTVSFSHTFYGLETAAPSPSSTSRTRRYRRGSQPRRSRRSYTWP